MPLSRILLFVCCLLSAAPCMAHDGPHSASQKEGQGAPAKPGAKPNKTAQAEAPGPQRFCMKNQQGKVHCIPFGPH